MSSYLYVTENTPFRTFEEAQKHALGSGYYEPDDIYKYNADTLELLEILRPINVSTCHWCTSYEFEDTD